MSAARRLTPSTASARLGHIEHAFEHADPGAVTRKSQRPRLRHRRPRRLGIDEVDHHRPAPDLGMEASRSAAVRLSATTSAPRCRQHLRTGPANPLARPATMTVLPENDILPSQTRSKLLGSTIMSRIVTVRLRVSI